MADYAAAYGAGGAADSLRAIVAEKLFKEKQAEMFRQARAAEAEAAARRQQDAEQARAVLAERVADRAYQKDRDYQADLRDTRREDARLQERQIEREIGAKDKIDTRAQHVADVKAQQDFLIQQGKDARAHAEAMQNRLLASQREIAGMRQPHERTIKVSRFDKATGTNVDEYLTESEARARGVLDTARKESGGAKTQLADLAEAERLGTDILARGEKLHWRGIGPLAGRVSSIANEAVGNDPQVARLHAQIGNLYSLISHERFGAALTEGEQARAKAFLALHTNNPAVLREKVEDMLTFVRNKRANLMGMGPRPDGPAATTLPDDGAYDLTWSVDKGWGTPPAPTAPAAPAAQVAPPREDLRSLMSSH